VQRRREGEGWGKHGDLHAYQQSKCIIRSIQNKKTPTKFKMCARIREVFSVIKEGKHIVG